MTTPQNDAPHWFIKVKDTVYGPYNEERLRTFAHEGRMSARSLISTQKEGEFQSASEDPVLAEFLNQPAPRTDPANTSGNAPGKSCRFVVYAQISEHSRSTFMESLSSFGVAIEAMPDVWLLSAHASAAALRNAMSQVLGAEDLLFIADASQGSSAWFNVGQDADNRIRQFWQDSE
ncbi:MAG: hypothetical protein COA84_08930 [Robiginitomaculum sp.]|nr:MAG: hypothetical protein COA84_08930 [Robiginitomaculum sp.]